MSAPAERAPAAATPDLDRLERCFAAVSPLFRGVIGRLRPLLGPRWERACDEAVRRLFPGDAALRAAVEGYGRFAMEVLRAEARFARTGAYVEKSYADATREVYANDAYMHGQYLPGLLLSHYLWPHHFRQACFFEDAFLADVARGGGALVDVGIGTGFYSRLALAGVPGLEVRGYDVSAASCAFAAWHAGAFGHGARYRVERRDVVADPPVPAPWLVSVEVLEHLEDPVAFLRGLRRLLAPGGKAFVTAALNAPHADHLYLYRTPAEVVAQLEAAGFRLESAFAARADRPAAPGAPVAEVAAFVVT
jgi:2-polyprenyl-3-methyl-5-hydroxy-6-metoxy-1,4-benzoquinol methylase